MVTSVAFARVVEISRTYNGDEVSLVTNALEAIGYLISQKWISFPWDQEIEKVDRTIYLHLIA